VLRVDELAKLGGRPCLHQRVVAGESPETGGCRIHPRRPGVCRAYRCAWLAGAFGDADRPDRLGAVLDFSTRGDAVHLVVRQLDSRALERSERLREIVAETRTSMPVELRDVDDVLDPERPYRVLRPDGRDLEIAGDRLRVYREGRLVEERRAARLERAVRRLLAAVRAWRLRRWPSHEERVTLLGLADRADRADRREEES
jgi:hypothetical protein